MVTKKELKQKIQELEAEIKWLKEQEERTLELYREKDYKCQYYKNIIRGIAYVEPVE